MALSTTVALLKAAGDPTRLRLLGLLAAGELTVGELVEILGQSQPRVSRHLKLLADAGLVSHFRDGQWVYYRLRAESAAAALVSQVIELARAGDPAVEGDLARLAGIRARRERTARAMPTGPRAPVDPIADRPSESALRAAFAEALGSGPLGDVLDVGTGSGMVLRLLGLRARAAVGVDAARGMRVLARSRVQEAGLAHCTIRAGDVRALPFPDMSFDVVVLDEVLRIIPHPELAVQEALRTLKPAGRLLILDRILPAARRLPAQASERCLFENQLTVMLRGYGLQLSRRLWFPGKTMEHALFVASPVSLLGRTGTSD
jgi:ArsR family transcriptional regulator